MILRENILFPGKVYKVCLPDHRAALPFLSVQLRSCPLRHPVSISGWSLSSDKQASVPCRQCHCVAWPEHLGNKANTCPRQLLPFSGAWTPNQGSLHFQNQSTEAYWPPQITTSTPRAAHLISGVRRLKGTNRPEIRCLHYLSLNYIHSASFL